MEWLMSGGELLAGVIALFLWWLVVEFLHRRNRSLTNFHLVFIPMIFLPWAVGGVVLVLRGLRLL